MYLKRDRVDLVDLLRRSFIASFAIDFAFVQFAIGFNNNYVNNWQEINKLTCIFKIYDGK